MAFHEIRDRGREVARRQIAAGTTVNCRVLRFYGMQISLNCDLPPQQGEI
jgi:hypothetical protein